MSAIGRAPHIVVAEDDPAMARMLADALEGAGYQVTSVADGAELVDYLAAPREAPVDLVVSDVRMPRTSGLEALAVIRRAPWRVPVLLITAYAEDTLQDLDVRFGAVGTLSKPFELDELRSLVAALLGATPA